MSLQLLKKSVKLLEDNQTLKPLNKVRKPYKDNKVAGNKLEKGSKNFLIDAYEQCKNAKASEKSNHSERVEENVKRFLQLSGGTIKLNNIEKIVQPVEKFTIPEKGESIFTDEDFKAFEDEYFKC